MEQDSSTLRAKAFFAVKEIGEGDVWIALELGETTPGLLEGSIPGLELKKGTSMEKAREISKLLRQHVEYFSLTLSHPKAGGSTH
jgi:hypothetical protein